MPEPTYEEKQLLETLKLIDAHRLGKMDADELEEAIWRVRHGDYPIGARRLWMTVAGLLAAAILLYAIA